MWLILLALHVVGLTGYNLLLRKSLSQNIDRWALATIMQTGVAIPMLIALFIYPPQFSAYTSADLLLIPVATLLVIALHWTNVKALQYLEAGVYAVIYNLRIIFSTMLGVLVLHDQVIWLQIAGGLLIFLAILVTRQKGRAEITWLGVQWGIAASLAISFLNLSEKILLNSIGFLNYFIPVMLLSTALMWGVLLIRKQSVPLDIFIHPQSLLLMGLRALSAYGATLALAAGVTISLFAYISSLSVITTVLFGMLLLKETDYLKQKLIATGLAVVGLTLILLANLR